MPTAVIAEDEALLADVLREHLAEVWPDLSVVACAADGDAALQAIRSLRPDVAFLDIRMPGLSGIEVARRLFEDPQVPAIVFVTAYDQYALEAFDAAAVDYLLKPVSPERLSRCVQRVRQRLDQQPQAGLATLLAQLQAHLGAASLPGGLQAGAAPVASASAGTVASTAPVVSAASGVSGAAASSGTAHEMHGRAPRLRFIRASLGDVTRQIPIEEVLYFDAQDKYVSVVTRDASALVRTALSELLASLDPDRFAQIHRSTIVNLDAIDTIRRDITGRVFVHLRGAPGERETKLAVSRQFAALFKGM